MRTAFMICENCGKKGALRERIRLHWRQLTIEKEVPVAKFGGVA